jgi:hypothetical protein
VSVTEPEILRPRVPPESYPRCVIHSRLQRYTLGKGKPFFMGRDSVAACHGRDGKGLGKGLDLKGPLPRDFTDPEWQAGRADGELFWILKNGSQGTAMAPFRWCSQKRKPGRSYCTSDQSPASRMLKNHTPLLSFCQHS